MKRAPNLKHQPKDKMTEVIIFAGSDAWAHAKEWSEWAGKHIAADDTHPVILGPEQLASLADTQIIDKGRYYVRVYRAGEISEQHLTQIATLLAVAGVKEARCYHRRLCAYGGCYGGLPTTQNCGGTVGLPR